MDEVEPRILLVLLGIESCRFLILLFGDRGISEVLKFSPYLVSNHNKMVS